MDEFEIVSADRDRIAIRHKAEGHEVTYAFHINSSGRRALQVESFQEGAGGHGRRWLAQGANMFVEREAERLNLFSL